MLTRRLGPIVAGLALALFAAQASAQEYTFFGQDINNSATVRLSATPNSNAARTSFMSYLVGVGTETFEAPPSMYPPIALSFPGAGTATLTGSGSVQHYPTGTNGAGRYPISGSNFYEIDTGANFTITFSDAIAAFGFYGIDVGDFGQQLYLDFIGAGGTITKTVPHALGSGGSTDGSVIYYGYINQDDPFTSVRFHSSDGEYFAFDDMTIGSIEQVEPPETVPEPATLLLLGSGLAGLAARRRRRA